MRYCGGALAEMEGFIKEKIMGRKKKIIKKSARNHPEEELGGRTAPHRKRPGTLKQCGPKERSANFLETGSV